MHRDGDEVWYVNEAGEAVWELPAGAAPIAFL